MPCFLPLTMFLTPTPPQGLLVKLILLFLPSKFNFIFIFTKSLLTYSAWGSLLSRTQHL